MFRSSFVSRKKGVVSFNLSFSQGKNLGISRFSLKGQFHRSDHLIDRIRDRFLVPDVLLRHDRRAPPEQ